MPRLHMWLLGAALAGCGRYAFRNSRYADWCKDEEAVESVVGTEKYQNSYVTQQWALLNRTVQDLPHGLCSTNWERLFVYCKIQLLRSMVYRIPLRAMPEADRKVLLLQMDKLELKQCTALNFRERPLSFLQTVTCQLCYGLYILCFCVIEPVLHCFAAEQVCRQFLHNTSKCIVHLLQIPVSMTLEEPLGGNSRANDNDKYLNEPCYLVFYPQHWVEVVGFWACPVNPLLTNAWLQLWPTSLRESIPYDVHWYTEWKRMQNGLTAFPREYTDDNVNNCAVKAPPSLSGATAMEGDNPTMVSSYAYPCASLIDSSKLTGIHTVGGSCEAITSETVSELRPAFVPVVSYGLPRVLFVNNSVARSDVRSRRTQKDVYNELQRLQYQENIDGVTGSDGVASAGRVNGVSTSVAEEEQKQIEKLRLWKFRGGAPLWHRITWGSVHGGDSQEGNRDQRELQYRIGSPCSASQIFEEHIQLFLRQKPALNAV
uniref:Uncharacterized protein TCIL3000_10_3080 n=1 Tax=Trypanosoma congolense (strain IL3000) TaxID=1068625 RepID=G0UVY1_TRYCI|nr:unnamed protein product [Trypanosoma congolense IL3000]